MKQMRSRFRLITLLITCSFLIVFSVCTAKVLKLTGVTLPSLSSLPLIGGSVSSDSSASPEIAAEDTPAPAVPDTSPEESVVPETPGSPAPEYNTFGL